ncbi:MAG TPA: dicarboxylate/amino acid:cation symporter [Myxococcales bacterium LLY-WYZ-16_1]|nr:dicarboxylate/amino acid:cation symporter [Myxococcales bacterium LLY-WYZ-16_1]
MGKRGKKLQLYTQILIGMAIGTGLGLTVGPNAPAMPEDAVHLKPGVEIRTAPDPDADRNSAAEAVVRDAHIRQRRGDWIRIDTRIRSVQRMRLEREGFRSAAQTERLGGWVDASRPRVQPYSVWGQRLVDATEWIGRLFLALIKMVVVPLVFFSLVVGVASLGDFRRLGRLGGRTLALFTSTTVVALSIGVGLANFFKPGRVLSEADRARLLAGNEDAVGEMMDRAMEAPSFVDQVISVVPENPVESLASGDMLQIIFFAAMFGIALTLLDDRRSRPVVDLMSYANDAMVMLVHIAMKLAPIGVAALLFKVVGTTGLSVLVALAAYGGVVLLGLFIHAAVTYGGIVTLGGRLSYPGFLKAIRPAMLLAFSTSSSSATLPVTKECVEDEIGVSNEVSSFVLPLGATVNMDGTALYQGVAALFVSQIYGMELTMTEQITIISSATLASVGAAGVPGAGLVTLAMVLTSIGVPSEGLALILGVDRLLDMFRTGVNVIGDSAATVFMARLEGAVRSGFSSKDESPEGVLHAASAESDG